HAGMSHEHFLDAFGRNFAASHVDLVPCPSAKINEAERDLREIIRAKHATIQRWARLGPIGLAHGVAAHFKAAAFADGEVHIPHWSANAGIIGARAGTRVVGDAAAFAAAIEVVNL